LRSISIAYENVPSVRSNARRSGCDNRFSVGPSPERVAGGNNFASPNSGIAKPTRDCKRKAMHYGVSNQAWRSERKSIN
jgi:hypothetical protein